MFALARRERARSNLSMIVGGARSGAMSGGIVANR